jgi:geranylgeranyl diphosphate synthase type II
MPFPTDYWRHRQRQVEAALDRWTPAETEPPQSIHRAMRYSLFAGGKRIRPLLAIEAACAVQEEPSGIENAAIALEFVHTYSLVHDDLPALDNDDLRRGRPTCHKVFGEALAILVGDALLTLAFLVLAELPGVDGHRKAALAAELARAAGTQGGMIAGQVHDLEGNNQPADPQLLERIHRAKTGALLRASVRMGGIYAEASPRQMEALSWFGDHIGLAFQIVDDVLDVEQSSATLGKTAGKDAAQGKITFPAVYGLEESRRQARHHYEQALAALDVFGARGARLAELASLIIHRTA